MGGVGTTLLLWGWVGAPVPLLLPLLPAPRLLHRAVVGALGDVDGGSAPPAPPLPPRSEEEGSCARPSMGPPPRQCRHALHHPFPWVWGTQGPEALEWAPHWREHGRGCAGVSAPHRLAGKSQRTPIAAPFLVVPSAGKGVPGTVLVLLQLMLSPRPRCPPAHPPVPPPLPGGSCCGGRSVPLPGCPVLGGAWDPWLGRGPGMAAAVALSCFGAVGLGSPRVWGSPQGTPGCPSVPLALGTGAGT